MWQYFPDAEAWRFVLAVPSFDEFLPKQETVVYRKIADALAEEPPILSPSIADVKLLRTDSPFVSVVGKLINSTMSDARIEKMTFNGIFIDEIVVIRSISSAMARQTSKAMSEAARRARKP